MRRLLKNGEKYPLVYYYDEGPKAEGFTVFAGAVHDRREEGDVYVEVPEPPDRVAIAIEALEAALGYVQDTATYMGSEALIQQLTAAIAALREKPQ